MFEQMYYRPNLWQHQFRVLWLTEALLPIAGHYFPALDPEKARILAIVHDDAEIVTGDIQAGHKARMSPEELQKIEQEEIVAVETLILAFRIPNNPSASKATSRSITNGERSCWKRQARIAFAGSLKFGHNTAPIDKIAIYYI